MLNEETIRGILHASRVGSLGVANPHGPPGLEQLAAALAAHQNASESHPWAECVRRPIELPMQTWEKLGALADTVSQARKSPIGPSELAALILEQYAQDATS